MGEFKQGDRVMIPTRNNQSGSVRNITSTAGLTFYQIVLDTGATVSEIENNVVSETMINTPFDLIRAGSFQEKVVFTAISTMNKLKGANRSSIASLKSSKTKFHPYQFKPLLKFLNSPSRRILIADEVGLGKTIEAGYILTEMALRGLVRNCLVICKSSLKIKWQTEMAEKFGFDFTIYSRKDLLQAIKEDTERGWKSVFGIINYDYTQTHSDAFLKFLEDNEYHFDMLIVDEAHVLRNESTIKHRAVKQIISGTEYVTLMTATPVMTSVDNLYSLLKIIEPHYEEYTLFRDHLELSRPFIQALQHLNEGSDPRTVISQLKNQPIKLQLYYKDGTFTLNSEVFVYERFKSDELFQEVLDMEHQQSFSNKDLVRLQHNLSELNSFHPIITRTRKREIQKELEQVVRDVKLRYIDFTDEEMNIYQSVIDMYDDEPLALVTKKRQATSCLPAYLSKANNRVNLTIDSKFEELRKIITEVVTEQERKLIVFSYFKGTLQYLADRLKSMGITTARIDGDVPVEERQQQLYLFRDDPQINVLLSSEVGSEGLDIQFCDALVNYDLPWNPMVVEQRIGRIDRVGQQSKIIYVYNLCITETIEEQIVNRLFRRIGMFKESLGLLEDILSSDENMFENEKSYELLENKLYGSRLSAAAKERLLAEAEQAIENALLMKKKIEKNLKESFVSDLYIKNQIAEINREKKYVTDHGIKELLSLLFKTRLASVKTDLYSAEPYIRAESGSSALFDFIQANIPPQHEQPHLFRGFLDFRRRNRKKEKIDCTFNQNVAFDNKQLEFLSATHPLVQATFHYFKQQKVDLNKAFCFLLPKQSNTRLEPGLYVMAIYDCEVNQAGLSGTAKSYFELPLVFHFVEGAFVEVHGDLLSAFLETDASDFIENPSQPSREQCLILSDLLLPVCTYAIYNRKTTIETEERKMYFSRQFRLIDTELDYLSRRLDQERANLAKAAGPVVNFIRDRIKKNESRRQELLQAKVKIQYSISENIQSISIIEIK